MYTKTWVPWTDISWSFGKFGFKFKHFALLLWETRVDIYFHVHQFHLRTYLSAHAQWVRWQLLGNTLTLISRKHNMLIKIIILWPTDCMWGISNQKAGKIKTNLSLHVLTCSHFRNLTPVSNPSNILNWPVFSHLDDKTHQNIDWGCFQLKSFEFWALGL